MFIIPVISAMSYYFIPYPVFLGSCSGIVQYRPMSGKYCFKALILLLRQRHTYTRLPTSDGCYCSVNAPFDLCVNVTFEPHMHPALIIAARAHYTSSHDASSSVLSSLWQRARSWGQSLPTFRALILQAHMFGQGFLCSSDTIPLNVGGLHVRLNMETLFQELDFGSCFQLEEITWYAVIWEPCVLPNNAPIYM